MCWPGAARRRTAEQRARIEAACAAIAAATGLDEWTEADLTFHEAMLHATNNELLVSLFSVIETALATYFVLSARTAANFKYSRPHHKNVLDAIRRRQPEVARQAMAKVVLDSRSNLRRHPKKA